MHKQILLALEGKIPTLERESEYSFAPILCPVCGGATFDSFAVCPCCGWEYDSLPEDQFSAANGAPMTLYRAMYRDLRQLFLIIKEKEDV